MSEGESKRLVKGSQISILQRISAHETFSFVCCCLSPGKLPVGSPWYCIHLLHVLVAFVDRALLVEGIMAPYTTLNQLQESDILLAKKHELRKEEIIRRRTVSNFVYVCGYADAYMRICVLLTSTHRT